VGLRPIRRTDAATWYQVRQANYAWLAPWEASAPGMPGWPLVGRRGYGIAVRRLRAEARLGRSFPFTLTYQGRFVGQVTVGSIARGPLSSAYLGYWIDQAYAGRGIMPTALALTVDHCFFRAGLHRVEANIRPENAASRRVVEKLGFREEGMRLRYLYVEGKWCDHLTYALTVEDVPEGLLNRWLAHS
jgi:ribosomal-protein-alanine N-acetyltransferase